VAQDVVRHEAYAIRRERDKLMLDPEGTVEGDGENRGPVTAPAPSPTEQAERFERLRLGAEALAQLKPQEVRAITLVAQGYSYKQICEETGWTYTRVNRCLSEGRQSFLNRVAGIKSGEECTRLRQRILALLAGKSEPADVAVVRRHLRRCLACRAILREQQLAPFVILLFPIELMGRVSGLCQRVLDLATVVRLKVSSMIRSWGVDPAGEASHLSFIGTSQGGASTGFAKGLALLCIGGASAGGAAAGIGEIWDSPSGPPSARASSPEVGHSGRGTTGLRQAPDARPGERSGRARKTPREDLSADERSLPVDSRAPIAAARALGTPSRLSEGRESSSSLPGRAALPRTRQGHHGGGSSPPRRTIAERHPSPPPPDSSPESEGPTSSDETPSPDDPYISVPAEDPYVSVP
jgi:hypothetical protein